LLTALLATLLAAALLTALPRLLLLLAGLLLPATLLLTALLALVVWVALVLIGHRTLHGVTPEHDDNVWPVARVPGTGHAINARRRFHAKFDASGTA
jgi:hypothetical protein